MRFITMSYNDITPSKFWRNLDDLFLHLCVNCRFDKYQLVHHKRNNSYLVVVDSHTAIDIDCLRLLLVVNVEKRSIEDVVILRYNQPLENETVDMKEFLENYSEYEEAELSYDTFALFDRVDYVVRRR